MQLPKPKRQHPELHEQKLLCHWLEKQKEFGRVLKYSAINPTPYKHSYQELAITKAAGQKKGVPDMLVLLPTEIVWIEMKRPGASPSSVSEDQREWNRLLNSFPHSHAYIAYSAEEAIQYLTQFIPDVSIPKASEESNETRSARSASFHSFIYGEGGSV